MKTRKKIIALLISTTMIASMFAFYTLVQASSFDYPRNITMKFLPGVDANRYMSIVNTLPSDVWSFTQAAVQGEGTDWYRFTQGDHTRPRAMQEDDTMISALATSFPTAFAGECFWGLPYTLYTFSYMNLSFANETDDDIKQRIWHELCHGIPSAESADTMHKSSGFIFWMRDHYPTHAFLSDPVGYGDSVEILLKWNQFLTETYGPSKTYYSYNDATWTQHSINLGNGQTGKRHIEFDATPSANGIDGSIDYADSSATVDGFEDLAMQVRFNPSGYFDVRNGASFTKTTTVNYSANTKYRIELVADMSAHTYNVFVTPNGGSRTQIASNYAFRTGCPATDDVGKLYVISEAANQLIKVEKHKISRSFESFNSASWTSNGINLGTQNNGVYYDTHQNIEFDITPSSASIDGSVDFADTSTNVTGFNDLAIQVRLNPSGYFDVRNGASFTKTNTVNYAANTRYHVKISADMTNYNYSVWVTPYGSSTTQIASDYAFRTGCPTTNDVGKMFVVSESANNLFKVDNFITRYAPLP
ncbi:MAG: hypothetical protein WC677_07380 [Clostridia bacterium]|jgi:unsaturated chondroitin disaccharide hydrolase